MKKHVIVVLLTILLIDTAFAGLTETITYQRYLTDASGQPVNGTVDITFSIYDVQEGGATLWTETQTGVTVTQGRYGIALGSVTPLNLPFDAQYYPGIAIGADPDMTPRLALMSMAHAFQAAQADGPSSTATGIFNSAGLTNHRSRSPGR